MRGPRRGGHKGLACLSMNLWFVAVIKHVSVIQVLTCGGVCRKKEARLAEEELRATKTLGKKEPEGEDMMAWVARSLVSRSARRSSVQPSASRTWCASVSSVCAPAAACQRYRCSWMMSSCITYSSRQLEQECVVAQRAAQRSQDMVRLGAS